MLACAGSLAVVAPAHASGTTSLRVWTDALSSTFTKQLNPETSIVGPAVGTRIKTASSLIAPQADPACATQETSQPFAPWRDTAKYVPAPNGGFEQGLDTWAPVG